jgi:ATP-binding cassette subfamily D (ALD) long-chain fatty acid import protein
MGKSWDAEESLRILSGSKEVPMANQSTLRLVLAQQTARFAKVYSAHRPLIQRLITIGFILYGLGNTWYSLSPKQDAGAVTSRQGKGKGKGREGDGRPPRVAVRIISWRVSLLRVY